MERVNSEDVKELIEALQAYYGSPVRKASLTEVAELLGTSRQNLANWMKDTPEQSRRDDIIEKGRKILGWDEGKTYKKVIKKK